MRTLGILCLVAACTTVEPATPPGSVVYGLPLDEGGDPLDPLQEREKQGTTILGGFDTRTIGTPYYFSRAAKTAANVNVQLHIEKGELVYAGMPAVDPGVGLLLRGYDGATFTIYDTEATPGEPRKYFLVDSNGVNPCGVQGAIPHPGRYSVDADHTMSSTVFSFSCEPGEVYKCNRWKYQVSDSDVGPDRTLMEQYHQACINMAGARYCKDRRSFTREKTEITIFDRDGIRANFATELEPWNSWVPWTLATWPAPINEFYIESAFLADGTPKCLRRSRWASLEIDPCGTVIADPRTTMNASYCEDLATEGTLTDDVLLVVASRVVDARFDVWRAPNGDLLGTSRGFRELRPGAAPRLVRPYTGFTFVSNSGVLLRVKTEDMIERGVETVVVNQYCEPATNNCVVTTPATRPSGYTDRGIEGELFVAQQPDTVLLQLWSYTDPNTNHTDWVSATVSPGQDWDPAGDLGYVYENPE